MSKILPSTIYYALCFMACILPLSIAASNLCLGLLTLFLIFRHRGKLIVQTKSILNIDQIPLALSIYIAAGLLSAAHGIGPTHSLHDNVKDMHRLWAYMILCLSIMTEPEICLWNYLSAGFAVAALLGIVQFAIGVMNGGVPAFERAHAFVHPVTFGEQMALALLGSICFIIRSKNQPSNERITQILLGVLFAIALALSQTRAALISFVFAAGIISYFEPKTRRWIGVAFALGLVAIIFGEFFRYGRMSFSEFLSSYNPSNSSQSRYVLWRVALNMFRDYPWTGVGPGHYRTLFTHYFAGNLENQSVWGSAHNLYLHQLAERGLIGLSALLILFSILTFQSWQHEKSERSAVSLWGVSSIVAFMIMNLTETAWQTEQLATLLLLIVAWSSAKRIPKEIL